jgi:DNA-binding transcriptional LysR family regulator
MEFRQLRYFVTLAEELHFGRAAQREHIVQSALSQQLQRLERELGVPLVERTTHRVQLTAAGSAFLLEARQILAHVDRAVVAARHATCAAPMLRVGTVDASYDSMPQILRDVQERAPALEVHQVEAGVPQQVELLLDGRLDVGFGRAALVPRELASRLVRLDPLGVLVPRGHRLAAMPVVPVATLAEEHLLFAAEERAPEFNQFLDELCRAAGFTPRAYRGTVASVRAGSDLVAQGRCVSCVPASCGWMTRGVVWRCLVEPVPRYPWSLMWRADDRSESVRTLVDAGQGLSRKLDWLEREPPRLATG